MLIYVSLTVLGLLGALSGWLSAPGIRRTLAMMPAMIGLGAPFIVPESHSFLRSLVALTAALVVMRAIDLARDPRDFPTHVRIGFMFSVLDLRTLRPIEPRVEIATVATSAAYGLVCFTGFYFAMHATGPSRWLLGAIGMYCLPEAFSAFMVFATRGVGTAIPKQHDKPILSRSVSEFWSRRWNLNVRDWLFRNCHRPLALRGHRALGIAFAFFASTLLHFWMVVVPLGWFWAIVMGSFFMLQGALVLVESRLSLAKWPEPARRAWTVLAVLGPSPLFTEPMLRILGG